MEHKTPLYDCHVAAGGKIVPFAGYLLPIQYSSGIVAEHLAVRRQAGLFDVSHMGEILCRGRDALANLQRLMTNDFTGMEDGQARYSPMCYENGGIVDDLIVYKVKENDYFIVVNAANKDKDFQWMKDHQFGEVQLEDRSDAIAQIALQGPKAQAILERLAPAGKIPAKYYHAVFDGEAGGIPCVISRTGYTGEDGFEFYLEADRAPELWDLLLETGKDDGLIPCGLGARDTLRLEASMPLYGHEMDETITPLEADLAFAVKMNKDSFIGKEGIQEHLPLARKRVGLQVNGRGIVREHTPILADGREIGASTSGTHCPFLGRPVAMALLEMPYTQPGTKVTALVRGREVEAEVVSMPFYKKERA